MAYEKKKAPFCGCMNIIAFLKIIILKAKVSAIDPLWKLCASPMAHI